MAAKAKLLHLQSVPHFFSCIAAQLVFADKHASMGNEPAIRTIPMKVFTAAACFHPAKTAPSRNHCQAVTSISITSTMADNY